MHELQPEVDFGVVPPERGAVRATFHQFHHGRHVCVDLALLDQDVVYAAEGELSQVILSREEVKDSRAQAGGGEGRAEGAVIPSPLGTALKQAEGDAETEGFFEEGGGTGEVVGPPWGECRG